jgi:molybdopterin/thiamine biosynthesis adenylyltransferase
VKRCRWWESGERSIEDEVRWFEEDGLDFKLNEVLLRETELVVFEGELRFRDERSPARVFYPESYASDGHPLVIAPDLPVERHRTEDGYLCLDHPVLGEMQPMCGAEAVARAERLWQLWEENHDQLQQEEADAPDPRANYYAYAPESELTLVDAELGDATQGYFDVSAHSVTPLRGLVTRVRATHPKPMSVEPPAGAVVLEGPAELAGAWKRVPEAPPFTIPALGIWLEDNHRAFRDRQVKYAAATGVEGMVALLGFVYPDEGPGRGQTHDAWLVVAIHPDGKGQIVRTFHLREDERWLRQPQLAPLAGRRVVLVGAGALGSQVANLLAQAGVGGVYPVDSDIVTHGNRVRHQLDLRDVGRNKAGAVAQRLLAVNPWMQKTDGSTQRVGGADPKLDDQLFDELRDSDLLINASAHSVTGKHLSAMAVEAGVLVVHGWVSAGAWGARVLIQRPRASGCWQCLALAQTEGERYEHEVTVPPVPQDPEMTEVTERGCADPSFTGPGFELAAAAAAMARIAVQVLLDGDGYPAADFDLATFRFRDERAAVQDVAFTRLPIHPSCPNCNPTS